MKPDALTRSLAMLDMSVAAAKFTLRESPASLEDRLRWFASELERLAGEAYNLADEASSLEYDSPTPSGTEHTCDDGQPPSYCDACLIASSPSSPAGRTPV